MRKNTIKLNEAQLKRVITESVKKVLRESMRRQSGNARGETYLPTSVYENVVDSFMASGKLGEDDAEKLFKMLENVFANVKLKARFHWWTYPGNYYNPPEEGCELTEIINEEDVIEQIDGLQIPDEIKIAVVDAFEEWCSEQDGESYDEIWEIDDNEPEPDIDYYEERQLRNNF